MDTDYLTAEQISSMIGVTERTIRARADKEDWSYVAKNGRARGGVVKYYPILTLPGQIQAAWVDHIYKGSDLSAQGHVAGMLEALKPEAVMALRDHVCDPPMKIGSFADVLTNRTNPFKEWDEDKSLVFSLRDLENPRVARILNVLHEIDSMPPYWDRGKSAWVRLVANKHGVTRQTIYKWQKKYDKKGIAGICHRKNSKGKARAWDDDALERWKGITLKREHRKIDKRDLYDILVIEAHRNGWKIGGYSSAIQWFNKFATPQFLALQRGGMRALDNTLPPVLRDYSDLAPFEMLVGDQHRWDFWVVDDETGEVFRPESYMWQDLRTRTIYGVAIDHKYDSQMIGLALQVGVSLFGAFGSIYTDNGRPEVSKYVMSIMRAIRSIGSDHKQTIDAAADTLDVDPEDINPMIATGTHKKAIVKNAKAKMIEGTFDKFERILRSHFRIAGSVKRLTDDIHAQDIDQADVKALVAQKRLPYFSEFALALFRACDYYNGKRNHRGVLKEWPKPKPKTATPYDCLRHCMKRESWRPRMITDRAARLLFLTHATRKVNMGRVQFEGDWYESDALVTLNGRRVDLRYDPMDLREIYLFRGDEYLGTATPVEYSSMKDMTLAQRKIVEKRERRAKIAAEYRSITTTIPDFRQYSEADPLEKAAALIEGDRRKKAEENREMYRERTPDELTAEVEALEKLNTGAATLRKKLPSRPGYFLNEIDRYEWCVRYQYAGGELSEDDSFWMAAYESRMTASQREYWETMKEVGS